MGRGRRVVVGRGASAFGRFETGVQQGSRVVALEASFQRVSGKKKKKKTGMALILSPSCLEFLPLGKNVIVFSQPDSHSRKANHQAAASGSPSLSNAQIFPCLQAIPDGLGFSYPLSSSSFPFSQTQKSCMTIAPIFSYTQNFLASLHTTFIPYYFSAELSRDMNL